MNRITISPGREEKRRTRFARGAIVRSTICLLGLGMSPLFAQASEAVRSNPTTLALGVLAHDRGPFSDQHEEGVDLNLEAQFAPLTFPGSPRPHLGFTANFEGDTSIAYAGLNFRLHDRPRWALDGIFGVAVHNGPLHKDPVRCEQFSDCGYGTRFLPRLGVELAYKISLNSSIALLYDHMSHKWIVAGENEGLDHIGVRYLRHY